MRTNAALFVIGSASAFDRHLFLDDGSYCNEDGTTPVGQPGSGDFRFSSIIFSPKFQPKCDCTALVGGGDQLHCQNDCETCFDDVCGVLETTEQRAADSDQGQNYSLCMTYSHGRADGKTCFEYELEDPGLLSEPEDFVPCHLKHNGVACTWCKMFTNGCIQSNCTNFLPDAKVNTCRDHNRGLVKQFKMAALVNSLPQTREIAQGACGVREKLDTSEESTGGEDSPAKQSSPDSRNSQTRPAPSSSRPFVVGATVHLLLLTTMLSML